MASLGRRIGACCLAAVLIASILTATAGTQTVGAQDCPDVLNVWARGSGQGLGSGEGERWYGQFDQRLVGVSSTNYELGTATHGGAKYSPVAVGGELRFWRSWDRLRNSLEADASWTGGLGGKYRASVSAGVVELVAYLKSQASACKDQLILVGGYSQGAHVIGDALPLLDRSIRDRIAFAGFFGDPKLYLPEGRGIPLFVNNHACNGHKSPWRRGNVGCLTDSGSLDARKPYLPSDMESKTGSWCNHEDFVCNNNPEDIFNDAHGEYKLEGGYIDEAVREGTAKLKARIPDKGSDLRTGVLVFGTGTAGVDVVFVLDSTSSMGGEIASAKSLARVFGNQIVGGFRGRVALTEYRDQGDAFVSEIRSPLTRDIDAFESAVDAVSISGGGDSPEAALAALMTSFDGLDWTPGATKAAVLMTDAGYHDPDKATGVTLSEVVARSLEIDPVNVYPVVPSSMASTYGNLADRTSGKVVVDSGDTSAALTEAIDLIRVRPVVLFSLDEYLSPIGSELLFDASRSYATDGSIVRYEWDFDGDGVFDLDSAEPTASHTFDQAYDGLVELRVTDSNGNTTNGVVSVKVSDDPVGGNPPPSPTGVVGNRTGGTTAEITWEYDAGASDLEGFHVGVQGDLTRLGVAADARTIRISDLPTEDLELTLAAYNRWGWSEPVAIQLAGSAEPTSTTSSSTTTSSTMPSVDSGDDVPEVVADESIEATPSGTDSSSAGVASQSSGAGLAFTGSSLLVVLLAAALACFAAAGAFIGLARRRRVHGGEST